MNALCILNKDKALKVIRRDALLKWMRSLKLSNGAFRMHTDGEEDLRYLNDHFSILCKESLLLKRHILCHNCSSTVWP